ncbi:MFS transporter [Bifidobacterium eulemuris]|uniref:MFS transporter n=1 Tax=Bifidobacterium eulemuris TaxID=1765219 RepID=A0A261G0Q4_9BIFI|nr:MFS transporter [Bifidobacterium eulemuris]OZG65024.1 MFS transporter [Bifidobacterium eulemuris]QOL32844.1 MFS transporter [Bifidobacterium eulemuris]
MTSESTATIDPRLQAHYDAIAAAERDHTLSPETGKPVSKPTLFRFGAGFIIFGLLWMSGLGIVSSALLPEHLKTVEGIAPEALVSIINSFTAVASLVSNLLFGNFSDRSRSRFGRRTPFILGGAVLGGVTLFATGMTTNPVIITIVYCACMFGLNCMLAPMVAMISDRIPMGVRGTMSAFYGAGASIGSPIGTLIGSYFILNRAPGFVLAGVLMFLGGVIAVIIIPKEGSAEYLPKDEGTLKDVLMSFRPPKFSGAHDFYKAFAGRLCMLLSYQMIAVYQLYIFEKYVGLSVADAGVALATMSVILMVVSLAGSIVSGPISDFIGRRKVPVVVASVLFAIGTAMPWIMPTTMGMFLYAGIAGFGYGVYSSVDQALNVDVLPSKEEAGKDLGILNLATTIGQMLGPVVMGVITLNLSYAAAFPISIFFALLGCVFILMIKGVK